MTANSSSENQSAAASTQDVRGSGLSVVSGSAQPESQMDSCLAICPYCKESYQVECDDYSEYDVEEECFHCGKTYLRCTSFDITHHTRPLPNNPDQQRAPSAER
jgi:hypothetical protein